jgi:hypothetical protein
MKQAPSNAPAVDFAGAVVDLEGADIFAFYERSQPALLLRGRCQYFHQMTGAPLIRVEMRSPYRFRRYALGEVVCEQ